MSTDFVTTEIYFVEFGDGTRLSGMLSEAAARSLARDSRERLCRQIVEDGEVIGDELVFDYGVSIEPVSDDTGAELCDECGYWSVELVSSDHGPACSLNPKNIV